MRSYISKLLIVMAFFALLLLAVNRIGRGIVNEGRKERNIVTDRINAELEARMGDGVMDTEELREEVFVLRRSEWEALYGKAACPDDVRVMLIDSAGGSAGDPGGNSVADSGADPTAITAEGAAVRKKFEYGEEGARLRGIYLPDGTLAGIAEYSYSDPAYGKVLLLMNAGIILAAFITLIYALWIYAKVIVPFNRLSDYPERLSKGEMTEKLPAEKDSFFGRYVWGMNMLSDKLDSDRKTFRKMNLDHQKFVTTLVHGIKTPAVNIKLMAEAIATGLYDPEGKVNEKDAELAKKIEGKADEIERLVAEAVDETNTSIFEYDPNAKAFYRNEIVKFIEEEYSNTFKIARLSFNVVAEGNPLVASDLDGVRRILRQILDNAIKYGDGKYVTLKMEKREEGHFISVANSGETLSDTELPFVFNSLWRGSNSRNVNGSGIGLYEARLIARKLGGDIRMKTADHETELILFLPI